jgi:hypothetical protein
MLSKYRNLVHFSEIFIKILIIILGSFILHVYLIVAVFLILRMFIMIVMYEFENLRADSAKQKNDYEVMQHLANKVQVSLSLFSKYVSIFRHD